MSTVKVSFTIPEETFNLLKRTVPKRSRSAFVAKRIEEELRRKKLLKAIRNTAGVLKGKGLKEWETEKSTKAWIRKTREADSLKIDRLWRK